jgi:hypothetical protein
MFETFPDPEATSPQALEEWVNSRIALLQRTVFTPEVKATFQSYELKDCPSHAFGSEASSDWRRFFLATLLADWACYDQTADRADYARLKYIMTSAYRYFRVWCCRLPDGNLVPVGYTGWYPIAKFVFEGLSKYQTQIDDRGIVMPLRYAPPEDIRYAYAFNVSVIKPLRNTLCSRRMIRAYQKDAKSLGSAGIAAITVGPDGVKFSKLAQLTDRGTVIVQGEKETLFLKEA